MSNTVGRPTATSIRPERRALRGRGRAERGGVSYRIGHRDREDDNDLIALEHFGFL